MAQTPQPTPAQVIKSEGRCDFDEKQKLLRMSEISLWLDTYDDIFSDFDPRPYFERALSDDFLSESKKAAKEKSSGMIDLKFLIPADKRDPAQEAVIKKRLHDHFKKHYHLLSDEVKWLRVKGALIVLAGVLAMMGATFIRAYESEGFMYQFLFVLLEPTGWFITWFGLDQIFYVLNEKRPDFEFYEKMFKCDIHFTPY